MEGGGTATPFVGRGAELARLVDAWSRAKDGRPTVALVAGEAGAGKSRLAMELARHVTSEGGRVLAGACSRSEASDLPYLPFAEMLRSLAGANERHDGPDVLGDARAELARLVPELGDASAEARETAGVARVRLFDLVLGVAERLGARVPTLVVVEDLHWADASTRDLLLFLARNVRTGALLLLVTWRSDEPSVDTAFGEYVAELGRLAFTPRVELAPLDRAAVAALSAAILGREPGARLVDRLVERSGGVAFFVEELAELERDAGGTAGDSRDAPTSLRDIVGARLRRLSNRARTLARAAAVAGRHVDDAVLTALTGLRDGDLQAALRELHDARVLVSDEDGSGHRFRHGLLEEAAYLELLPGERRALHERCAAALEAHGGPGPGADAAISRHWLAARRPARAFAPAVRAATLAEAALAFAEALEGYERALAILRDLDPTATAGLEPDRAHLHERAAVAATLLGDRARSLDHARAGVITLPVEAGVERVARAHGTLRWALWHATEVEAALVDAQAELAGLPASAPPRVRADVMAHTAGLLLSVGRHVDAARLATEAAALAAAARAEPEAALATGILGWCDLHDGRVDEGLDRLRATRDAAVNLRVVYGSALAHVHVTAALLAVGRADDALREATAGIEACRRLGVARTYGAELRRYAAEALWRLGRWSEMAQAVDEALREDPPGSARGALARLRARLAAAQGRTGDAERDLAGARSASAEPWTYTPPGFEPGPLDALAAAELAFVAGDASRARETLPPAGQLPRGSIYAPELAALAARAAAEAALEERARGRGDAARESLRRFARQARPAFASRVAESAGPWRDLARAELRRGAGTATPAQWRRVQAGWVDAGAPYPAAYAAFRVAEALVFGRAPRREVVSAIREAHAAGAALGAAVLVADVARLGRHARVPLDAAEKPAAPDAGRTDGFGLTRREREVLTCLSDGMTNREIARTLFMSESTASVHVSRLLGKLGVRSRVEAATLALRLNLVERSERADPA